MATQHYQEQEQDDLMAAFDSIRKEVEGPTLRRRNVDHNRRKEVNKPTLKTNFYQDEDVPMDSKKSSRLDERAKAAVKTIHDVNERNLGLSDAEVSNNVGLTQAPDEDGLSDVSECLSSDFLWNLTEEIHRSGRRPLCSRRRHRPKVGRLGLLPHEGQIITAKAGVLRNVESICAAVEKLVETLDVVYEVPKYQEELKYITALVLICYGGSWTMLAGIIAAVEIFGTEEAVQETMKVGNYVFYQEYDNENEVSPEEIKETFKNMALHFALMLSVVICPSVSEICVSIAVAGKFSPLVPAEELLKKIMISSEIAHMDLDDYFGLVDTDWFELLSLFGCNIISIILYGCFPRLINAIFMGYFGFCLLAESLQNGLEIFIPFRPYSGEIEESFWTQKTTQYYVWGFVAVMAVWQAINDYSGSFVFISWSMFLYPAVRIYNIFVEDPECPEDKRF